MVQHEHKYEQLLEEAKKLDLDAKSCCLLKVRGSPGFLLTCSPDHLATWSQVVALFASDGSTLRKKRHVEKIQDDYCLLLYRCGKGVFNN